jgi:hypothetical protein
MAFRLAVRAKTASLDIPYGSLSNMLGKNRVRYFQVSEVVIVLRDD